MKKLFYLLIFSILLLSCEEAYKYQDTNIEAVHTNQTILDSIAVLSFVFDSEGTAWIGTLSQGLVKYSLTETKIFDSSNSQLTNDPIWDITVDSKDNIWIGTFGLVKYDGVEFTTYNTANSEIPEDIVWSVAVDATDNIWVASNRFKTGGLAKFDGVSFEVFTPENSLLPVNGVKSIAIDSENKVWASATETVNNTYLIKISGDLWTVYDSIDFNQKIPWVKDIEINSDNQVCGAIGYYNSMNSSPNVYRFDGSNIEMFPMEGGVWEGFESILVDSDDNFWCTFGHGYAYYDGTRWSKYITETIDVDGVSYYNNAYFTFEQAPDGNIWIGTGKGIEILDRAN